MAECAIGQPSIEAINAGGGLRGYGHSKAEACAALGTVVNPVSPTNFYYWDAPTSQCMRSSTSATATFGQVCTPPTIEPGEVGPITLTAACPASAPCVFSMFTDGSIPADVTPATAVTAIAFGLGAVLSLWAIGYVIGIATGLIKKA